MEISQTLRFVKFVQQARELINVNHTLALDIEAIKDGSNNTMKKRVQWSNDKA